MTNEEKARAYDEALEDMMAIYPNLKGDVKLAVEHAFPQLVESEDERIRKEINSLYSDIDTCISKLLKARTDKDSEAEGKALFKMEGLMVATLQDLSCIEDYLEKQKEQKPVEINEYEIIKKHITEDVLSSEVNKRLKECGWYVTEKPAEWSKEDEENFEWFDKFFRAESVVAGGKDIPQDKYFWFKSLRPQPKAELTLR